MTNPDLPATWQISLAIRSTADGSGASKRQPSFTATLPDALARAQELSLPTHGETRATSLHLQTDGTEVMMAAFENGHFDSATLKFFSEFAADVERLKASPPLHLRGRAPGQLKLGATPAAAGLNTDAIAAFPSQGAKVEAYEIATGKPLGTYEGGVKIK